MSTKIIKVLKNDKLDELLDLFKEASAEEVIFILPKKARAFSKAADFGKLKGISASEAKAVSFMTPDPEAASMAKEYKFSVLSTPEKQEPRPKVKLAVQEDPYTGEMEDDGEDEETEDMTIEEDEQNITPEEVEEEIDEVEKEKEGEGEGEDEPPLEELGEIEEEEEEEEEPAEEYESMDASSELDDEFEIVAAASRNTDFKPKKTGPVNLKIPGTKQAPAKILIKKGKKEKTVRDIENVWQRQPDETIWSKEKSEEESAWSKFWKKEPAEPKKIRRQRSKHGAIVWGTVVSAVILGIIVFVTTGKAEIIIKPQFQRLDIQLKVSSSNNFPQVDLAFNKIPGQLFKIEKTVSQTFQATGEKDVAQKARGRITVYNELGTAQPLIATTRFESPEGLIFRTLTSITVPQGTSAAPGKIDVEVIAEKPGQNYNIGASKFVIPAFREKGDQARFEKIYGKSESAMRGGIVGRSKIITESDFNTAKNTVELKLREEINAALTSESSGLVILNASSISFSVAPDGPRVDDAVETFTYVEKGTLSTIGFKKEDLDKLISQYVEKSSNLMTLPDKLEISYSGIVFNPVESTMSFTASIKGNAYSKIEQDKLIQELLGKKESEIKDKIKAVPGIASARVILSPFWVRKIPKNSAKVEIKFEY